MAGTHDEEGSPQDCWRMQIDERFRPWNGGTGYCETGREAKEAVQARVPKLRG